MGKSSIGGYKLWICLMDYAQNQGMFYSNPIMDVWAPKCVRQPQNSSRNSPNRRRHKASEKASFSMTNPTFTTGLVSRLVIYPALVCPAQRESTWLCTKFHPWKEPGSPQEKSWKIHLPYALLLVDISFFLHDTRLKPPSPAVDAVDALAGGQTVHGKIGLVSLLSEGWKEVV